MEESIPKLNILITNERICEGALQIVHTIRPEWRQHKLHYKIFTDGITNRLIGVYKDKDKSDMILTRVYGENTDLFIDRQVEFRNMRAMYKAGLSAPIYCTFLNGISYGFSSGSVLDYKNVVDPIISKMIAENLARMHTLKPLIGKLDSETYLNEPQACLFPGIDKFLVLISSALPQLYNKIRFNFESLQSESKFLKSELVKLQSPIVFCHNDLLLKNIIMDFKENKVTFIDFEYSDYNYQAFDIANHFCEFCGIDSFDSSLYPSKEFQIKWLRNYLQKLYILNDDDNITNLEQNVENLYETVNKFSLAAHFYWGLWALVQLNNSSIDFDYAEFAMKRLDAYFLCKNIIFSNNNH